MPKGSSDERESALQSGWTVESSAPEPEPAPQTAPAPDAATLANRTGAAADAQVEGEEREAAEGDAADGGTADVDDARPQQVSNFTVVLLGVTGGLFLLYAWVWLSWAKYYASTNAVVAASSGTVGGVLQEIVFWMAPLAPLLWFITSIALLRRSPRKLIVALVIGLLVTLPLPMIFQTGAAL